SQIRMGTSPHNQLRRLLDVGAPLWAARLLCVTLALSPGGASAYDAPAPSAKQVTVYMQAADCKIPGDSLMKSKRIASQILSSASVRLDWRRGSPSAATKSAASICSTPDRWPMNLVVLLKTSRDAPPEYTHNDSLAFTTPFTGFNTTITVL